VQEPCLWRGITDWIVTSLKIIKEKIQMIKFNNFISHDIFSSHLCTSIQHPCLYTKKVIYIFVILIFILPLGPLFNLQPFLEPHLQNKNILNKNWVYNFHLLHMICQSFALRSSKNSDVAQTQDEISFTIEIWWI
jgi:hypothetical protein